MCMVLRGHVVPGIGNFSYWIEKLHEHYFRKTAMRLYPGTLNVLLERPYSLPKQVIRLEGSEYDGTVSVSMVPCTIRTPRREHVRRAFLLRTDANEEGRGHHPKTIVEIATDVRLRDVFGLQDGDVVEIAI